MLSPTRSGVSATLLSAVNSGDMSAAILSLVDLDPDTRRETTSRLPLVALRRLSCTCSALRALFPQELHDASLNEEPMRMILRCQVTMAPLLRPARGPACTHHGRCNFDALQAHHRQQRACPVAGCTALCPPNGVLLDEVLYDYIQSKPDDIRFVWFSADGMPRAWDAEYNDVVDLADSEDESPPPPLPIPEPSADVLQAQIQANHAHAVADYALLSEQSQ